MNARQRIFSLKELNEFNGRDEKPAYVAYKGKVYDVSASGLWKEGKHRERHLAGDELTSNMLNAPHADDVLSKFPVVGDFIASGLQKDTLVRKIEKLHPHSMLVHFSIAYALMVPLLAFLFMVTGQASFETASYYLLAGGALASVGGGLSGVFSWKVTYEGQRTRVFTRKILLTILLIAAITTCFMWRTLDPAVFTARNFLSYVYFLLTLCAVPLVALLGHYGGKIVFI